LLNSPDVETVWVDEPIHRAAIELLILRQDKTYSLCDAVSFILMRQRSVFEALTTDRHFEQEGFVRLLKPANVAHNPPHVTLEYLDNLSAVGCLGVVGWLRTKSLHSSFKVVSESENTQKVIVEVVISVLSVVLRAIKK